MLARIRAAAVLGIDAYLVDVEVDITNGLPSFSTVGLPHGAVREGRERIWPALANCGYKIPLKKITILLAPADVPKSAVDGGGGPGRRMHQAHRAAGQPLRGGGGGGD